MFILRLIMTCSLVVFAVNHALADAPATEFFVVESAKLAALASEDVEIDSLSGDQLGMISVLRGSYTGGLSMRSETASFRIDARFTSAFSEAQDAIDYNVSASSKPDVWDVCSEKGRAQKNGKQFITKNWRTLRLVVVLRSLNLKR